MTNLTWPYDTLKPGGMAVNITARTLTGAASLDGSSQITSGGPGIWRVTLENIPVATTAQVLKARAIAAYAQGRLNTFLIPLREWEGHLLPLPDGVDTTIYDPVPHSDGSYFSDGTGYAIANVIETTATSAAIVGATSLTLTIGEAGTISAGMHFSVGDTLYRVSRITYASDTSATLYFFPGLRAAVAAGDIIDFDNPRVAVRLATDTELDLALTAPFRGAISPNFVEAL